MIRNILAKYLSAYKIKALPYHAGLSDSKRQLVQNQWANDDCQVELNVKEKFFELFLC
jgi:superfamily II DNA helicase RecQ